jgi:hypothetical protein
MSQKKLAITNLKLYYLREFWVKKMHPGVVQASFGCYFFIEKTGLKG